MKTMPETGLSDAAKKAADEALFWLDQMEAAEFVGDTAMQMDALKKYKATMKTLQSLARTKIERQKQPWFFWSRPASLRG